MKKLLLAVLLACATAASANVARLKPVTAPVNTPVFAPSLSGVVTPSLTASLLQTSALTPALPALAAKPAPTAAPITAPFAAAHAVLSAPPAEAPSAGEKTALFSSLRESAGLSGHLMETREDAEAHFARAVGLGRLIKGQDSAVDVTAAPADSPRFGDFIRRHLLRRGPAERPGQAVAESADPLYDRLLQRVTLDDRGNPAEKAALDAVVRGMLKSPTARKFAEQLIEEGIDAVVRFSEVEGSKVYTFDGRRIFYAPRAFTDWKDGKVEVRLNRDYLDSDLEYLREDAPPTLAHELLGHGLWYGRMAKSGLQELFHIHENNETNAKLVGWLAAWELNKRFHDTFAWDYLADPARYLQGLKIRQPYYSVTYTTEQMGDPVAALKVRLTAAKDARGSYEQALTNIASWSPIIDHFVTHHGVPAARFTRLREDIEQRRNAYNSELANLTAIENAVSATIDYYQGPGASALPILASAGTYPQLSRLQAEVDQMTTELRAAVSAQPARAPLPAIPWPQDQIDWDELKAMFQKDSRENPSHWRAR